MKKKIFMLAVMLTVVMFSQVRADSDVIEPDENDKAILTCAVGSSDDLTMIPIIISLSIVGSCILIFILFSGSMFDF